MVVVVVVVVVVALSSSFLSFSFSLFAFAFLSHDVDVLVDVPDGLTREVHVAVGKEVISHLKCFLPCMMWTNLK